MNNIVAVAFAILNKNVFGGSVNCVVTRRAVNCDVTYNVTRRKSCTENMIVPAISADNKIISTIERRIIFVSAVNARCLLAVFLADFEFVIGGVYKLNRARADCKNHIFALDRNIVDIGIFNVERGKMLRGSRIVLFSCVSVSCSE